MEISSIALLPEKNLAVGTRRGDIWICKGAYGDDLSQVTWKKFAQGLHEPLGMFWEDGWLWITQRPEVTKIRDVDSDGLADEFLTVSSPWNIDGNYHEYAFGSEPDNNGDIWVVLCLTGSGGASKDSLYRGWGFRIGKDGTAEPVVSGVRSPGGIGFNALGDPFYCDNQGSWNGSSSLKHLKVGGFMGNPSGHVYFNQQDKLKEPKPPVNGSRIETERARIPNLVPPAVILPHSIIGNSPTAIITDNTENKFGPFSGQTLIGEQSQSQVQRVYLEKVNEVYQGAVWHFLDGYLSGIIPMRLSDEGFLFVGGSNRGWGSKGTQSFNLERTKWTGVTPFEMSEMKLTKEGWELSFTKPVDQKTAEDLATYTMESWTYIYQKSYGSPRVDISTPTITNVTLSDDHKTINITVEGRKKGHVHHLNTSNLRSSNGESLWHPDVYYTLNEWVQ